MAPKNLFEQWDDNNAKTNVLYSSRVQSKANLYDESQLLQASTALKQHLDMYEKAVTAANKVSKLAPNLAKEKYKAVWSQHIIPDIVNTMVQNTRARSSAAQAFGLIHDLAIVMRKASEAILQTQGSQKGIQIARKYFAHAKSGLETLIEDVRKSKISAMHDVMHNVTEIFEILGPEAAKFVETKAELQTRLTNLYNEQIITIVQLRESQVTVKDIWSLYEALRNGEDYSTHLLHKRFESIQRKLNIVYQDIRDADAIQIKIEGLIGLHDKALIECLIAIKEFDIMMKNVVPIFESLETILSIVLSSTDSKGMLLAGPIRDVLVSANQMEQTSVMLTCFVERNRRMLRGNY